MTKRPIVLFGDPVLSTPAAPITTFNRHTEALIRDLMDTVDAPGRAGVAAPQIGVGLRAFSYRVDGQIGYVINRRSWSCPRRSRRTAMKAACPCPDCGIRPRGPVGPSSKEWTSATSRWSWQAPG